MKYTFDMMLRVLPNVNGNSKSKTINDSRVSYQYGFKIINELCEIGVIQVKPINEKTQAVYLTQKGLEMTALLKRLELMIESPESTICKCGRKSSTGKRCLRCFFEDVAETYRQDLLMKDIMIGGKQ